MESTMSQVKNSIESFFSRLDQVENRIQNLKTSKVNVLKHSGEDKQKKEYKWTMQDLWGTIKRSNLWIMDIEERAEVQAKGI